ncbi:MAG: fibronectin type III domain-containing protein [Caldilineaceae bacterium]|nr:fibronectin type III domain-containing protein [Caldilineaceae bacterium]MDE0338349.1 fibronectin type III domain-containing protein [Caldilineaceae bacterium]
MLKNKQIRIALAVLGACLILAAVIAVLPSLSSLPAPELQEDSHQTISGLRVNSSQPGVLEVTWDAPADPPLEYRLTWARVGENFPARSDGPGNAYPAIPSQQITGLDQGVRYKVRVRARYEDFESDWSDPIEIAVASSSVAPPESTDAPTGPPQNLKAAVTHNTVSLTWEAPQSNGRVSGYLILRRDLDAAPENRFQILEEDTGSSATSFVDSTVLPGSRYAYRVRALNGSDSESEFADVEVSTLAMSAASSGGPTPKPSPSAAPAASPTPTPTPTTAPSATPVLPGSISEREALVAVYHATGGENWAQDSNWMTDEPLGSWRGVTTDRNGSVIELDLNRNLLSGYIPAGLGSLPNLRILRMSGNDLEGTIPAGIGNLSELTNLELDDNNLSGSIPAELGNLPNLTWLDLSGNDLSGPIPTELSRLTGLTVFALSDNGLTGAFPWWLKKLDDLLILHMSGNHFTGCMPEDLLGIWIEDLSSTHLPTCREALVTFFFATGGAQWENSTNWRDSAAPLAQWFGVKTDADGRVTEIDLSGNGLVGTLPPRIGALIHLELLDLSGNDLVGQIPPELGKLTNLSTLYLGGNRLSGCVPANLREIENNDLNSLGLDDCQ